MLSLSPSINAVIITFITAVVVVTFTTDVVVVTVNVITFVVTFTIVVVIVIAVNVVRCSCANQVVVGPVNQNYLSRMCRFVGRESDMSVSNEILKWVDPSAPMPLCPRPLRLRVYATSHTPYRG